MILGFKILERRLRPTFIILMAQENVSFIKSKRKKIKEEEDKETPCQSQAETPQEKEELPVLAFYVEK